MTFVTITSRLAHLSRSVSCQRVTACASLVLVPGTRTVITSRGMKLCGVPSRGDEQLGAQQCAPEGTRSATRLCTSCCKHRYAQPLSLLPLGDGGRCLLIHCPTR